MKSGKDNYDYLPNHKALCDACYRVGIGQPLVPEGRIGLHLFSGRKRWVSAFYNNK